MTILEAAFEYGTRDYEISAGDSLLSVVIKIYNDDADIYFQVLQVLNNRFDWYDLKPGDVIQYLPKRACENLYEITS